MRTTDQGWLMVTDGYDAGGRTPTPVTDPAAKVTEATPLLRSFSRVMGQDPPAWVTHEPDPCPTQLPWRVTDETVAPVAVSVTTTTTEAIHLLPCTGVADPVMLTATAPGADDVGGVVGDTVDVLDGGIVVVAPTSRSGVPDVLLRASSDPVRFCRKVTPATLKTATMATANAYSTVVTPDWPQRPRRGGA